MKKFTIHLKKSVFFSICLGFLLCTGFDTAEESAETIQSILNKYYDSTVDAKVLKRHELQVTNTGFCKYRKVYANGKVEFFSFNLLRFNGMDYYGTTARGELHLHTKNDDVIVQTHNDRKGNVDSMSTHMIIPLKGIDAEVLNSLAAQFSQFNQHLAKK